MISDFRRKGALPTFKSEEKELLPCSPAVKWG